MFICIIIILGLLSIIQVKNGSIEDLKNSHANYVIKQQITIKEQEIKNKTIELAYEHKIKEVLEKANVKIIKANESATDAKLAVVSLRNQTSTTASKLPNTTSSAKDEYITTCNSVLNDLAEEGTRISAKADGHAIDAETLSEAWPVDTVAK